MASPPEEEEQDDIGTILPSPTKLLSTSHATAQPDPESHISLTTQDSDSDKEEDDQIQDYKLLNNLTKSKSKIKTATAQSQSQSLLPRRGEKDFEPHGTQAQSSTLAASQAAMHEALGHSRVHGPLADPTGRVSTSVLPSHLVGFFDVETFLTFIPKEQGVWFRTMGRGVRGGSGGALLEPEEALFLCERGTLDLRFGRKVMEGDLLSSLEGLPMSLQAAYACCVGARGLTLERYIVYAGLKRAGYTVFRAKAFDDEDKDDDNDDYQREERWEEEKKKKKKKEKSHHNSLPKPPTTTISLLQSFFQTLLQNLSASKPKPGQPLLGTSFFRSYTTIYTHLSRIPTHTPSTLASQASQPDHPPLTPTFHAYRPSTPIRKTNLSVPDFYITVLDARDTSFPTATQLSALLNWVLVEEKRKKGFVDEARSRSNAAIPASAKTTSLIAANANTNTNANTTATANANANAQSLSVVSTPNPKILHHQRPPPHLYARLKNGRAGGNVLLAVVDSGLVSYVRVSEGCFAEEKVWMGNVGGVGGGKGGGKGVGARGGKGKGRGRGRGGRG